MSKLLCNTIFQNTYPIVCQQNAKTINGELSSAVTIIPTKREIYTSLRFRSDYIILILITLVFRLRFAPLNMTGELTKSIYLPVILSVVEESSLMPSAYPYSKVRLNSYPIQYSTLARISVLQFFCVWEFRSLLFLQGSMPLPVHKHLYLY